MVAVSVVAGFGPNASSKPFDVAALLSFSPELLIPNASSNNSALGADVVAKGVVSASFTSAGNAATATSLTEGTEVSLSVLSSSLSFVKSVPAGAGLFSPFSFGFAVRVVMLDFQHT